MIALRAIAGVMLLSVGVGLTAAPEIGGMITAGFVLIVAGATVCAFVAVDLLGIE